ncbi:TIM barrel protein [Chryseolinea sp. T2]|uniref:sugar phosphate isomerase/epimerase family protein n=1 Tax=Chryseolinea sp. T2 TaxID=3129255 RepID=UPI0030769F88
MKRRDFLQRTSVAALAAALPITVFGSEKKYPLSLAQFSLASEFFAGKHDTLTFPERARKEFGISIVEYVSMFFKDKATDKTFLSELKKRAADNGVKNNLIMVDDENIADVDKGKRDHAVESHYKWVDAAKYLDCNSIRVNLGAMGQEGTADEVSKAAIEGYSKLLEYADKVQLNVIVENHVGHSCNGKWLANVMKTVNHKRAGVLPDFGNFCVKRTMPKTMDIAGYMGTVCLEEYDKYLGVEELMPYAKGVSAKSHKFDAAGNETEVDFARMFQIIRKSGFDGIVGIEYEGGLMQMAGQPGYLDNAAGIRATRALLEKVGAV